MRLLMILSLLMWTAHAALSASDASTSLALSKQRESEADERLAQIKRELASNGDETWAGSYFCGDGLGESITVDIAPRTGFVFERSGCLGSYDRNYGTVDINSSSASLKLIFALPNDRTEGLQDCRECLMH